MAKWSEADVINVLWAASWKGERRPLRAAIKAARDWGMTYEQIAGELKMTTEDVEARATEIERSPQGQAAAQWDDPAFRKSIRETIDKIGADEDAELARKAVEMREWLDDLDRRRPVW
jgi:hypothetical protein